MSTLHRNRRKLSRRRGLHAVCISEPLEPRTLFATIAINGTSAADIITLSYHTANFGTRNIVDYSVTSNGSTTSGSAVVTAIDHIAIDTVANTTAGVDTLNILKTPPVPVTVVGHTTGDVIFPASDVLNIGDANGLQDLFGPVSISNASGSWNVTLDDSGDSTAARTGVLNNGLTGVAPAGITWTAINALTMNMGSFGGSTLNVLAPGTNSLAVVGNSHGADDSLVLGANHRSDSVGAVSISVAPGSPRALWNVSVDDSAAPVTFPFPSVSVATGVLYGLTGTGSGFLLGSGPFPLGWGPSSIRNITIDPPALVGVGISSLDVPMAVIANDNQIAVGNSSNGLQSISAALTLTGVASVTLNDTNDAVSRSVLMSRVGTAVAIDGLAPATISYDLPGALGGQFPNLEMDLSTNFDGGTLTMLAAGQASGLTKIVAGRPIAINVGSATSAPDIEGTVALYCTAAGLKNTILVNDSIDSTARNILVTATKDFAGAAMGVVRGLFGGGDLDYAVNQTAGPVTIDGGSGGNTFVVSTVDATTNGVAVGVPLTLNLGSGNDTATIKTNAVTINGQAGNDSATIDYSTVTLPNNGGTFSPGDVSFDGGANSDTLSILGKLATQAFGVTPTAITEGAQTTSFSNLESMALANGAFALASDLNGLSLSVSGSGSTANIATSQHLGALSVNTSAVATLASSALANSKAIFCTAFTLASGGALDLSNNALQVTYSSDPALSIRGFLAAGYNAGAWTGAGLRSSTAASGPANKFSLGLGDSADNVVSGLPANTLVVRYTVMGDANLDHATTIADATRLQSNFGRTNSPNWDQGDFNFDGIVNVTDALLMVRNYNAVIASSAVVAFEPVSTPATPAASSSALVGFGFTISGTTGADTIVISTHSTGSGKSFARFVDYSINGGPTQSQDLRFINSITVDTIANSSSSTFDTVNVQMTPSVPFTIIGHSSGGLFGPFDVLNVGDANGLQDQFGSITLNSSGVWNVTLDNSGDAAAARNATWNYGVTGVAPAGISWDTYSRVNNLTLNMGSFGGSTVNVVQPGISGQPTVNGYSQGADDTMVLGTGHVSSNVGPLTIGIAPGSPRGLWNVALDDSGDSVSFSPPPVTTVVSGGLSGLTGFHGTIFGGTFPDVLSWGAGSIRNLTVSPPGGEVIMVNALDIPMAIDIGGNAVQVGNNSNGVQGVTGALAVNGIGTLLLDDSHDVSSRSVLMSRVGAAVAIDGLAPGTISYNLQTSSTVSSSVEMDLWNNFDGGSLTVLASGQTGVLTKVLSPRPLPINVGNATNVPDIQGVLALYCTGSNLKNTLHVNDSIDSNPRNILVTATRDSNGAAMGVIRGLPGGGDVDYAHAQTAGPVVIDGGSGGNTFNVNATDQTTGGIATSVPLTLNLGSGNDAATIKTNAVTVNGQGGNDTLTVDYTSVTVSGSGTFSPGDVSFDGGANSDTLSIVGKIVTQSFGVIATAVTQGAQTTTFTNVESMALANGAFALANDLNGLNLKVNGSGSTANFSTAQHLGALNVDSSAVAALASSASANGKTIFCTAFTLTAGGALDLTNNAMQITYSTDPAASIRGYLAAGYNGGAWTGAGLRSSTAAGGPANKFSLGLGDSADNVVSGLPANTLVIRYTTMGDANLDLATTFADARRLQTNFGRTNSPNWDQGDFNFDGVVNATDAILMARNYNAVVTSSAVPAIQPAAAPVATTTTSSSSTSAVLSPTTTATAIVPQVSTTKDDDRRDHKRGHEKPGRKRR